MDFSSLWLSLCGASLHSCLLDFSLWRVHCVCVLLTSHCGVCTVCVCCHSYAALRVLSVFFGSMVVASLVSHAFFYLKLRTDTATRFSGELAPRSPSPTSLAGRCCYGIMSLAQPFHKYRANELSIWGTANTAAMVT
jgi:hypothetical protein